MTVSARTFLQPRCGYSWIRTDDPGDARMHALTGEVFDRLEGGEEGELEGVPVRSYECRSDAMEAMIQAYRRLS